MIPFNSKAISNIFKENDVKFAALFGSRARGNNRKNSDFDILIRYRKNDKSLLDFIGLEQSLSDVLGKKVDLVTEDSLHPYVKKEVEKDLKIIYGKR